MNQPLLPTSNYAWDTLNSINEAVWLAIVFSSRCCSDETLAYIAAMLILGLLDPPEGALATRHQNFVGLRELWLEQTIRGIGNVDLK